MYIKSHSNIVVIAFFKFENDVTDSSGFASDSNVSVSGSLTYDAGICRQAAVFDGNTTVTVQSFAGYAWGINFSVSTWFKRTGSLYTIQGIVNNGYYSYGSWKIYVDGHKVGSCLYITPDEGDTSNLQCLYRYLIETAGADWNHVVITFDGNQFITYLNGGNKQTKDVCCNRDIITKQTPVTIGHDGGGGAHFFFGLIDELRIYNHTMSESQVYDLYNTSRCT